MVLANNKDNCVMIQIGCGCHHSALLTDVGQVYTWGRNLDAQLGNGARTKEALHPTRISVGQWSRLSKIRLIWGEARCSSTKLDLLCFPSSCLNLPTLVNFTSPRILYHKPGSFFLSWLLSLKDSLSPNVQRFAFCIMCLAYSGFCPQSLQLKSP